MIFLAFARTFVVENSSPLCYSIIYILYIHAHARERDTKKRAVVGIGAPDGSCKNKKIREEQAPPLPKTNKKGFPLLKVFEGVIGEMFSGEVSPKEKFPLKRKE